jgi:hypothetical protein
LNLSHCRELTKACLPSLAKLPNLQSLNVTCTKITNSDAFWASLEMPHVKIVSNQTDNLSSYIETAYLNGKKVGPY